VATMKQSEKEREEFLSVCGQRDYDLLTEKEAMTQADFERITHITMSLGFTLYTQTLIGRYLDFALHEEEQFDRELEIIKEYPNYYEDEEIDEKENQWIEDFLSQIPLERQGYYRQLVKQNTEEY
jgi:hypothetical protein